MPPPTVTVTEDRYPSLTDQVSCLLHAQLPPDDSTRWPRHPLCLLHATHILATLPPTHSLTPAPAILLLSQECEQDPTPRPTAPTQQPSRAARRAARRAQEAADADAFLQDFAFTKAQAGASFVQRGETSVAKKQQQQKKGRYKPTTDASGWSKASGVELSLVAAAEEREQECARGKRASKGRAGRAADRLARFGPAGQQAGEGAGEV
jgi:hypothetical protein